MPLISLRDVHFGFGGSSLLKGIDFQIDAGERVCLLGRNGAGKSTLLRLIKGDLQPNSGDITFHKNLSVAMLTQTVPHDIKGKVFDVVAGGLGEAGDLLIKYHNTCHETSDQGLLSKLHDDIDRADAWDKLNHIVTALTRTDVDGEMQFGELSTGLKRRVLMARSLAQDPDILILDEPTNHLDIDSIDWLEEFLLRSSIALLFVTHDRRFLKRISTRIVEVDHGKLFNWDCDYDDYLKRKEQLISAEQKHQELFDKKLAEEESWVRQGIKARRKRNQGRLKALQDMRLTRSQRQKQSADVKIEINAAQRSGNIVFKAKDVNFAYDTADAKPVISNFTTTILRGDRVGIIGGNGQGKTTLLRLLIGELSANQGNIVHGTNVRYAYFDQLHSQLDPDRTLLENIGQGSDTVTVNGRPKHVFAYLADFLFDKSQIKQTVSTLSGGERNRLQIAKVFTQPSNVLVLDEPTNDLDIETLELLEDMLIEYHGTVLLVSHDRSFLNNIVTSTLVLEAEGRVGEYVGGYDDWLRQRKDANGEPEKPAKKPRPVKDKPLKLTYKQKRELEGLPEVIEQLEKQIASLHEEMAKPSFYKQDAEQITQTSTKLRSLDQKLAQAYSRWEELAAIE
ncbi:MAG TPA: ATP-binding cassette domain-containing protein [Phycisphaerales bacterium]|nr:ATP-binding cassette domain-containing protein [Phycisphaerales bacterium]